MSKPDSPLHRQTDIHEVLANGRLKLLYPRVVSLQIHQPTLISGHFNFNKHSNLESGFSDQVKYSL